MNILCIGAHPDDVEIGMGGAICSFLNEGHSVSILDLTDGEPTPKGSPEVRIRESITAKEILGIENRITLNLTNRFLEDSQEARKKVAAVIRKLKPNCLFIPYWIDAHPDHVAASRLAEASRFTAKLTKTDIPGEPHYPSKIFYFFCLHLDLTIKPSFILDTSDHLDKKLKTVNAYESQFKAQGREEFISQKITESGRHWGSLIKKEYGEPFICQEEIGLTGLTGLIV